MTTPDLTPYQSDHLILLVGGNPLPNAVAAVLLTTERKVITLIHSTYTFSVAQNLKNWLLSKGYEAERIVQVEVHESEAHTLYETVKSACKRFPDVTSIGLHYTGGTKAMSVHAYRALKHWAGSGSQLVFSYLDARTLQLVFDPPQPEMGSSAQTEDVSLTEKISMEDLFALHGWELKNNARPDPFLPQTSEALMSVYLNPNALTAWQTWKEEVLQKLCRREDKPDRWKSQGQLRGIKLPWPTDPLLEDLTQALQSELGQAGEMLDLEAAAKSCGKSKIEGFCKWLDGGFWLETITLQALQAGAPACTLRHLFMNLTPLFIETTTDFELDVVALRGYQLFAFSCSVDESNSLLKLKLFEAFVRARQLGGEEARVALVCGSDDPTGLEMEIRQTLSNQGQIKVFGKQHWPFLSAEFQAWITDSGW